MACNICKTGEALYLVKKVKLCEDCYQNLMSLRYKSFEGFEWAQRILTDEATSEEVRKMIRDTIKEYRADAPSIVVADVEEAEIKTEKKAKVKQFIKKVLLVIIENF